MKSENDIQVLVNSKRRNELQQQAVQMPKNQKLKINFPEINRDAEMAQIIKLILPKSLKSSLMSGTLVSQMRKQKT